MMTNRTTRFAPATLQAAADARDQRSGSAHRDEQAVYERYQRRQEQARKRRDWLDEQWERGFGNAS